jgi:hypothetical protein
MKEVTEIFRRHLPQQHRRCDVLSQGVIAGQVQSSGLNNRTLLSSRAMIRTPRTRATHSTTSMSRRHQRGNGGKKSDGSTRSKHCHSQKRRSDAF